MKVCFVGLANLAVLAPEFGQHPVGGEGVQQTLLGRALARRGHDVSMVVGDYGQPDGAIYSGVKTIKAYRLGMGIPVLRFIYPRWIKLWDALAKADAQVYYVSCAGMELGLMAMFCGKHGKGLIFRTASDTDCDPRNLLVRYWRDRKLYEYGLRRADAILVQSEFQRGLMSRNYGLGSRPARMLIEPPMAETDDMHKDIDLLWLANLRQVKRPDRVLDLAARLPHLNFYIAGGQCPGEHRLYAQIAEACRRLPNVTFHGQVAYQDVGALFDRAKIFINTSDVEGFPNTYLQAWIRGLPVVATFDPDGIISREGLGVRVFDTGELAQAVSRILGNRADFEGMRQRCLRYMAAHYNEDELLGPYLRAMEAAVASSSQRCGHRQ
jgi:glycosyltransferase involved in cell wall biosynthesis